MDNAQINADEVLVALRRITRAIDLHSRSLIRSHGLTGPQIMILKQLVEGGDASAGALAESVSLSQATVTDILNRLERRGLITRTRSESDGRRVVVHATDAAALLLSSSPPLLQDRFISQFYELADWERSSMLSTLQRIATMMDATNLDVAPVLTTGPVSTPPEALKQLEDIEKAADSDAQLELVQPDGK